MVFYKNSLEGISPDQLKGFFVGWKRKPSEEVLLSILEKSYKIQLAIDSTTNHVVGFITALSDTVLSAYIPFLEVLPVYQNRGIGKELVKKMLLELSDFYMIDLVCDPDLQVWYKEIGFERSIGMSYRNYSKQSGQ